MSFLFIGSRGLEGGRMDVGRFGRRGSWFLFLCGVVWIYFVGIEFSRG